MVSLNPTYGQVDRTLVGRYKHQHGAMDFVKLYVSSIYVPLHWSSEPSWKVSRPVSLTLLLIGGICTAGVLIRITIHGEFIYCNFFLGFF